MLQWLLLVLLLPIGGLLLPLLLLYPLLIAALANFPSVQRHLLFLHKVNYPFNVDWADPAAFGFSPLRARNVSIRTKDNLRIGAWHILPASKPALPPPAAAAATTGDVDEAPHDASLRSRPVFLYFHGNAGNRAAPNRVQTYRMLATRLDCNVLAIDYRGFGDSEGAPTEQGLAIDARAAWDYLTVTKGVRASDVVLLGHSLGTGVATRLARDLEREGLRPRALVLQAPYSSIGAVMFEFRVFQIVPFLAPVALVPSLRDHVERSLIDRFDSRSHIKHLSLPILIIHGHKDREIPIRHARLLYTEALSAHQSASDVISTSTKKTSYGTTTELTWTPHDNLQRDKEGHVWVTTKRGGGVASSMGDEAKVVEGGPHRCVLVELHHAHHNSVQNHDLTYDVIEEFCELTST